MPSNRYVLSRIGQAVLTLFVVMSLTFVLIRALPGGPEDYLMTQLLMDPTITQEEMNYQLQRYLNLVPDEPLHIQYWNYMTAMVVGDLGISIWYQRPVIDIIADGMPWTVYLSAITLLTTFVFGVGLGAIMAYKEKSTFDVGSTFYTIVAQAIPYYIFAILLLWIFAYTTGWFPTGGRFGAHVTPGANVDFVASVIYHSFLPILSLLLIGFGGTALGMRANSIRILGEDYMRVARLRGLSDRRIALRYLGRNAILPLYTSLMISIGGLFGGSVILEQIFNYPGMGFYMFQAVMASDYPLMMGSFLFITAGVIVGVFFADLSYGWIDPRAGSASQRESFAGGMSNSVVASILVRIRRFFHRGKSDERQTVEANGGGLTNGGNWRRRSIDAAADSIFSEVSSVERTRQERLYRKVDETLLAPFRIISQDWRALTGFSIVTIYILMGTVGVYLTDPPRAMDHPVYAAPFQSLAYPLGTNDMGVSLLHQTFHATPAMFKMMLGGAVWATVMAGAWGIFSGYVGGKIDRVMMTIADILITIPGLPLIIVLAAIVEPRNPFVVGFLLTINGWAGGARNLRSQVLTLRSDEYVEASRAMGAGTYRIITRDLIPNLAPLLMIRFVSLTRAVISSSVALYFLGILPFTTENWGVMLNLAYRSGTWYQLDTVHWLLTPVMAILILSMGLILIGQACDHIFNPRIRARHEKTTPDDGVEAEPS